MNSTSPKSWRVILQRIIKPSGERQRLAKALDLAPMTLTRWAKGDTHPQRSHLVRLIYVVNPQLREELEEAIKLEYPDIHPLLNNKSDDLITSAFIDELLSERTFTLDSHRLYRISKIVLEKALAMLDPHHMGMAVTIAKCMPPRGEHAGKIYSLKEHNGRGTPPWEYDLESQSIFLGSESLGGHVTEHASPLNIPDLSVETMFPTHKTKFEVSAAAYPIMLGGQVAGCLSASSNQLGYFTPERLDLLELFSHLASLAFNSNEFYPLSTINLQVMPHQEKQFPVIGTFRQRAAEIQERCRQQGRSIRNAEAELQAWQEIETELLTLAARLS